MKRPSSHLTAFIAPRKSILVSRGQYGACSLLPDPTPRRPAGVGAVTGRGGSHASVSLPSGHPRAHSRSTTPTNSSGHLSGDLSLCSKLFAIPRGAFFSSTNHRGNSWAPTRRPPINYRHVIEAAATWREATGSVLRVCGESRVAGAPVPPRHHHCHHDASPHARWLPPNTLGT